MDRFDVAPDTTSTILISNNFSNSAVYKNNFNGYANYTESSGGATTCVQVYGGMHNLFFTDNYGEYLPEGVCITPYYKSKDARCVVYWSHFDRNKFYETGVGIRYTMCTSTSNEDITGEYSIGVTLRSNSFKNSKDYTMGAGAGGDAIQIGYHAGLYAGNIWPGNWINGVVVEHNTFEGSQFNDIEYCHHSGNTIVRDNKNVDKGSDGKPKEAHSGGSGNIEVKY